ncbi:hypothetical protein T459_01606 [Capsicum annuum]|uniref:Phospholipase D C-terminal domain-containing protein n=1 Tax=Capsicum annuum TaxID=4072 RepID=A0A2G3AHM6_CAPAN|nr:hypothetical protein T459_01606 [Capsicum annuum]
MTTIGQFFERPKSLEYVRQMSVFGEHNWLQYTADEVTEMRGHLLKNPVEIDRTGKVKLFHEYLKLNPLAYVPTLVEGDAVTVDSFAIIMAASMARSLDTGVPWVVCQHPYAPTAPCLITFSEAPSSKEGQ